MENKDYEDTWYDSEIYPDSRVVGRELYANGYIKECLHYSAITKEEYAVICRERVEMFVVGNKRIMNPIDKLDQESYFLWIKNKEKEIVACVRIIPPHLASEFEGRQYSTWDKGWIIDSKCALFPVESNKHAPCLWTPEWGTRVTGVENAIMDLYEAGHMYVTYFSKEMPGLVFLGSEKDKYGYEGWKWVWEPIPNEEAQLIMEAY
jgi:hypothetical protein|tara:strand:- start:1052 stop:1669 length:618 start_codon:yes stop_codon:yes gene_type:complete